MTVFEIAMPLFFAILLLLIRLLVKSDEIKDPTVWPAFKPGDVEFMTFGNMSNKPPKPEILFYPDTTLVRDMIQESLQYLPPAVLDIRYGKTLLL